MSRLYTFGTTVTKNEFAAIRGKRHRTIVYLVMILVFTFLCIGFANKALEYQKKLAVNPFSNWINIEVTSNVQDSSMNLLQALSEPALRDRFLIRNIYLSKGFGASFLDCNGIPSGLPLPKARTIDPGSPVIADLLDSPLECNTIDRRNVFRSIPSSDFATNPPAFELVFNIKDLITRCFYKTLIFIE